MRREPWDFDYDLRHGPAVAAPESADDLLIATAEPVAPARFEKLLTPLSAGLTVEPVIDRAPIHWTRVRVSEPLALEAVERQLAAQGLEVRYVASARSPDLRVPPALAGGPLARPSASWSSSAKGATPPPPESDEGKWFTSELGVDADEAVCGDGHGTRLAVIDYDAGRTDGLGLDALVPVMRPPPDRRAFSCHGASLVAWASRALEPPFSGVAPGASPRLYCVPRPGNELVSFPLALVRAVDDGADVVACATYLDGTTSPMLDDALAFAARFGRWGHGTPVVLAASREMESPEGSVRSSLSLDFGDPASDPRVICAGASGRGGGWFLWRDRKGLLRPFSNRGPAVHFLAPGDDVADPFMPGRLKHAESSGATAFVAGVVLLALAEDPALSLSELDALLILGARRPDPAADSRPGVASKSELLPASRDADGHNAKHGYGRPSAVHTCLAARDPVCLALLHMGEDEAACRYDALRREEAGLQAAYGSEVGREMARRLLTDRRSLHALSALLRHLRLVAVQAKRSAAHARGSLARQLALFLAALAKPGEASQGLSELAARAAAATRSPQTSSELEAAARSLALSLWRCPRVERARPSPFGAGGSAAASGDRASTI